MTSDLSSSKTVASACPLDCPDHCSLEVTVEDGRVTRVDGSRRQPATAGFICTKVRRFPRRLYGEDRLLHPLVRRGAKGSGDFRPVSWDDALERVAEEIRRVHERWGGEAILPVSYGGSNGYLSQDTTDARLFRRLGARRLARTVCAAATTRAADGLYGRMPGVAYEDYAEARLIVVWGANPSTSGIHLVPFIRAARKRGARLVVVDPRRVPLAAQADLHLAPRPGSDLVLALAVHRWLFEHGAADLDFLARHATGVDELRRRAAPWTVERAAAEAGVEAREIEAFARLYAATSPAVVRCGWGVERNRNGGSAVAAILALPAVAGKFGVRGGGFTLSNSSAWRLDGERPIGTPPPSTPVVNMNRLGRHLVAPDRPIRLLFVYNANPLATLPEQETVRAGLLRDDLFTVVFDQVMTDTARHADVVLPATTFLEHRELSRGYGTMALQQALPAVPPIGQARSNHDVFGELCRRLGLSRPGEPETLDDVARSLLDGDGDGDATARALADEGIAFPPFGRRPVAFVDLRPRTADGKIHLLPEALDREAPEGLYAYRPDPASERFPLALISPATRRTISSTLGELYRQRVAVELHPDDAAVRGIRSGDRVRVWNELGEVRCRARIAGDLRPGVAYLPKGLWSHNTDNGATANALVPADLTDLAGGACFNDARVEIERLG
ncbi:MAG: molybdopterin oxidoreductase family protein [Acidobacteria bacterium]|nr:MAG: molybdopterin oxidoreductase family protein [Acidobacteriota bacterium]